MPITPPFIAPTRHRDAASAVAQIQQLYAQATEHLKSHLQAFTHGSALPDRVRACYPFVRVQTDSVLRLDRHAGAHLSYGFVAQPGRFETTLTRPDLYGPYLRTQLELLLRNHGVELEVGISSHPIPVHFALGEHDHIEGEMDAQRRLQLRDFFDLPDLSAMDDGIANGTWQPRPGEAKPLSLFPAPRIDYSLHRLRHYTGTSPEWFQNFVLFTNYQFYIDEFVRLGRQAMEDPSSPYQAFIEPGNVVTHRAGLAASERLQGPALPGQAPPRVPSPPMLSTPAGIPRPSTPTPESAKLVAF